MDIGKQKRTKSKQKRKSLVSLFFYFYQIKPIAQIKLNTQS